MVVDGGYGQFDVTINGNIVEYTEFGSWPINSVTLEPMLITHQLIFYDDDDLFQK